MKFMIFSLFTFLNIVDSFDIVLFKFKINSENGLFSYSSNNLFIIFLSYDDVDIVFSSSSSFEIFNSFFLYFLLLFINEKICIF